MFVSKWEKITDLKAASWQAKYMTTRWGTCNTKTGKIWVNVQLAKKSSDCLAYIILHELVQLAERRHNDRFVSLMDKYMPMWSEIKTTLNGQSHNYMELSKEHDPLWEPHIWNITRIGLP